MKTVTEEKSIAKLFPELLVEWDFSKNATIISPTEVSKGCNLKVWWICPENHSYEKNNGA
ncbi:zinc-ribbon domain-containing protein [Solibacillus sp. FSL W7-1464]|uniref:zinc-ribbon domain-containing protein n=1 Tax=Solibacillus sp. FSL W7-1464 TaxID=2921706 RepID=UPI0030FC555A